MAATRSKRARVDGGGGRVLAACSPDVLAYEIVPFLRLREVIVLLQVCSQFYHTLLPPMRCLRSHRRNVDDPAVLDHIRCRPNIMISDWVFLSQRIPANWTTPRLCITRYHWNRAVPSVPRVTDATELHVFSLASYDFLRVNTFPLLKHLECNIPHDLFEERYSFATIFPRLETLDFRNHYLLAMPFLFQWFSRTADLPATLRTVFFSLDDPWTLRPMLESGRVAQATAWCFDIRRRNERFVYPPAKDPVPPARLMHLLDNSDRAITTWIARRFTEQT